LVDVNRWQELDPVLQLNRLSREARELDVKQTTGTRLTHPCPVRHLEGIQKPRRPQRGGSFQRKHKYGQHNGEL
jgi:hypothetical protein